MVEYKPIPAWMPIEDINLDGRIDLLDIYRTAKQFGKLEGQPDYDPLCDFNGDGRIDLLDIYPTAKLYGLVSVPPERKVQTGALQVQRASATAISGLASVATFAILAEAAKGIVKTLSP